MDTPTETSSPAAPRTPFGLQEECFLFCSLMLVTCLFLPWQAGKTEVTPWDLFSSVDSKAVSVGLGALFLLFLLTLGSVSRPRLRPWFGIVTALAVMGASAAFGLPSGRWAYGAELAKLSALGLLVLSARPALMKAGDLAMRRLNSSTAEVFSHWGTVLPGIQFSAQDFYAKLEGAIRERQWPGVEFLRVEHSEAGLLSHRREYLRVVRQRQVFDICASGFGKDYFFTLREAEIKAQLSLVALLILLLALVIIFGLCVSNFGVFAGLIGFGAFLVIGFLVLASVLRMGLTRLDGLLLRTPVIGPVYETWFRRSGTYFQHDSRVVFLKLMDDLVKELVDAETSAKGVERLSCFEHQPILDGLYKTSTHKPGEMR